MYVPPECYLNVSVHIECSNFVLSSILVSFVEKSYAPVPPAPPAPNPELNFQICILNGNAKASPFLSLHSLNYFLFILEF